MLCLSRREGESVFIGENIKLTIHRVEGKSVRLTFSAPSDVRIDREEILMARALQNLPRTDRKRRA